MFILNLFKFSSIIYRIYDLKVDDYEYYIIIKTYTKEADLNIQTIS